jgi:hypothetical protein
MLILAFQLYWGTHCEAFLWISSEQGWGKDIQAVKSDP